MNKTVVLTLCFIIAMYLLSGCKSSDYENAQSMYAKGDYSSALEIFERLNDYKNSDKMAKACQDRLNEIEYKALFNEYVAGLKNQYFWDEAYLYNVEWEEKLVVIETQ